MASAKEKHCMVIAWLIDDVAVTAIAVSIMG
jgi:hypothetical protein